MGFRGARVAGWSRFKQVRGDRLGFHNLRRPLKLALLAMFSRAQVNPTFRFDGASYIQRGNSHGTLLLQDTRGRKAACLVNPVLVWWKGERTLSRRIANKTKEFSLQTPVLLKPPFTSVVCRW